LMSEEGDSEDIMELRGWLKKKTMTEGKWSKRYAVLREKKISLFKDDKCREEDSVYELSSKTSVERMVGSESPVFILTLLDGSMILFRVETQEMLQKWITGIRGAFERSPVLSITSFEIVSVLGRGAFGKVMLVRHHNTQKFYAIKSIQKKKLLDAMKSNTAFAERNILMKARHPFIVQLFFSFQTPSKFYLGLEYVPGGELFFHMKNRGAIPVEEVRLYSAEIALALSYLHSIGIIYRDLKPENVMLDSEGHIKLTDFGLSTEVVESENGKDTFCGTSHYISPEMIYNLKYTYKIDWWSLGILMFEMITSYTPFANSNKNKLYDDILKSEPEYPDLMDPDAKNLISLLLTKNPMMRPGFENIRNHPFYKSLDWTKVFNREYTPKFIPKQQSETSNFDREFTTETAADSLVDASSAQFPGFSYVVQSFAESPEKWD
jgi:serine/threonine protein kinase